MFMNSMKGIFLLIATLFLLIGCDNNEKVDPGSPPSSWKKLKDFPAEGRSNGNAISFSVLGKGYFGLGGNHENPFMKEIWAYDPGNDSWEQKKDYPFSIPAEIALTLNDKSYLFTYSGNLYEYNPKQDSWEILAPFPPGSRPSITGFALKGNLYFGTGNSTSQENFQPLKDFWKYDPSKNEWTQLNDFVGASRVKASSFVIDEIAYLGLGYDGIGAPPFFQDLYRYNDDKDEWDRMADFPSSGHPGLSFSLNSKAYVGAVEESALNYNQMYEYSPLKNEWKKLNKLPSSNSLNKSSFNINNRIFVIGGWWSDYGKEVWEFVP